VGQRLAGSEMSPLPVEQRCSSRIERPQKNHAVPEIDTTRGATRVNGRGPSRATTARKAICTSNARVIMVKASQPAPVSHPKVVAASVPGVVHGSLIPGSSTSLMPAARRS